VEGTHPPPLRRRGIPRPPPFPQEYKDPRGISFWYNPRTRVSTWERPTAKPTETKVAKWQRVRPLWPALAPGF